MNNKLIKIKQLPIIEEQLKNASASIEEKINNVSNLLCNEETVKTIKNLRAELNKEFKEYEEQRKEVKEKVLKPYNEFEEIYKMYIADKYRNADLILKGKIDLVENELKSKKEQEVKDYFEEYKLSNEIDFITYEQAGINATLSASMKSLKEEAKKFVDKVVDDLKLIETQEHKEEILVEYKKNLNVSQSITTVTSRLKAVEEERKKQEELVAKKLQEEKQVLEKNIEQLKAPIEEKQEEILTLRFTVKATKTKLKELKQFLENGGYIYE